MDNIVSAHLDFYQPRISFSLFPNLEQHTVGLFLNLEGWRLVAEQHPGGDQNQEEVHGTSLSIINDVLRIQ